MKVTKFLKQTLVEKVIKNFSFNTVLFYDC